GFLQSAGALIVGFSMAGFARKAAAQNAAAPKTVDPVQVDAWIAVGQDGNVTGYSGKCDFGQGFGTVQYQVIAEGLSIPIERVRLIACDTSQTPDQGVTSGSQSSPTQFGPGALRQALATARDALFQMASAQFNVPPDSLVAQDGSISMKSDPSKTITYAELLAGKQFNLTVNNRAVPRDPAQYSILGTSVPRLDIPAKVTGSYQYVQNVRLPGMLHGKVVRPPAVGAKLLSVSENSLKGMP